METFFSKFQKYFFKALHVYSLSTLLPNDPNFKLKLKNISLLSFRYLWSFIKIKSTVQKLLCQKQTDKLFVKALELCHEMDGICFI